MEIRPFLPSDETAVVVLWECCGLVRPWNDPHKDIQRKLAVRPDLFLVGVLRDEVVATAMAGYEGVQSLIGGPVLVPSPARLWGRGLARIIHHEIRERLESKAETRVLVPSNHKGATHDVLRCSDRNSLHFRVFRGSS